MTLQAPPKHDPKRTVSFTFRDSVIVQHDNYRDWNVKLSAPFLDSTTTSVSWAEHIGGDYTSYSARMNFHCDSTYQYDSDEKIELTLSDPSSDDKKVLVFNISGAVPTMRDINYCN